MAEETVSLRDTLSAAVDKADTTAPETPQVDTAPSTPAEGGSQTPESPSGVPEKSSYLDEGGDKAPPGTEPPSTEPEEPKEGPAKDTATSEAKARVDRPPQSWKGDVRNTWNTLPLPVRQEVLRRERQIEKTMQEYSGIREFANSFALTIQPYQLRLESLGTNPLTAMKRLFEADRVMSSGTVGERAQFIAKLITDYDIDIKALDETLSGVVKKGQRLPDQSTLLRQEINAALGPVHEFIGQLRNRETAQARTAQEKADSLVDQMSLDPQFPHFDDLRMDMADLIDLHAKRGVALTLQQAYSKAAAGHPDIGPQFVAGLKGNLDRTNAQASTEEAQRARAASVSVSGAPRNNPGSAQEPKSLREQLERSISIHSGRR